jgi:glycosyltransferase involved in cell wall biosynthesis
VVNPPACDGDESWGTGRDVSVGTIFYPNPVVLGVDISRLRGPRTGVGRYLERVLAAWAEQPLPFDEVRLFTPAPVADLQSDARLRIEVVPARTDGIWWQTLRLAAAARTVDLFFAPYTLPPRLRPPSVVANLGILGGPNPVRGLRARARHHHAAESARRADVVIAHSEATRRDLERYYRVEPQALRVVHVGVDALFRPARPDETESLEPEVERIAGIRPPYLLFVGKISERRHLPALLEALAELRRDRCELSLLVVGPSGGRAQAMRDGVRYIPFLDQTDLATLYRVASAFVLPTIQEGFSFTILEALASGCPVVTADHAALDEGGVRDGVLWVARPTPDELRAAIERVLDDPWLRAQLRDRGLAVASGFDWNATARETMAILADVAGAR